MASMQFVSPLQAVFMPLTCAPDNGGLSSGLRGKYDEFLSFLRHWNILKNALLWCACPQVVHRRGFAACPMVWHALCTMDGNQYQPVQP
jgi:hypothetical protein